MKKRMITFVMAMVMVTCMLGGCSGQSKEAADAPAETEGETSSEGEGKEYRIGICNINDSDENCFLACDTMRQVLESEEFRESVGVDSVVVEWANSDGDIDKQTSNVETLLLKDIDALFMIGVSTSGSSTAVKACNEAGVPVFMVATEAEEGDWKFVGFDEEQCGYQQGKYLVENTEGEVNVCYMTGIPGQTMVTQRKDGFMRAIEEAGRTDIHILSEQAGNFTVEDAMQVTEDWLQAHGDNIDWIVTQDDKMASGVAEVLKAADKVGEIKIDAWVVNKVYADLVKDGLVEYVIYVDFVTLGETMANVCRDYLNGEEVPERTYMDIYDVTLDNVAEYFN